MLKVGDPLPDFEARATDGRTLCAASLRGNPVVLFFFPKAFTPGCTKETKAFRDEYPCLARAGVQIVGVSTDGFDKQCQFAEWAGIPFPLLGDDDRCIAKLCGVLWPILAIAKRVTFVVDEKGVVRHVFHNELRIDRHVSAVKRAALDLLQPA